MNSRLDRQLSKGVAAVAAMLMMLLVIQSPVAMLDRMQHDTGHLHAANAFAGAVLDGLEHDHDIAAADHDGHVDAESHQAPSADAPDDPSAPSPHHHHHDSPSVYGLAAVVNLPEAWSSEPAPFRLDDDLRKGIGDYRRDRPPKTLLVHVA